MIDSEQREKMKREVTARIARDKQEIKIATEWMVYVYVKEALEKFLDSCWPDYSKEKRR